MNQTPTATTTATDEVRVTHAGREFRFVHDDPDDHIFRILRSGGRFYEADLLSDLEMLVSSGDAVIDVGANIGNHAVFFAGVCGCRVVAIEPNPRAARLLERNAASNGLSERIDVRTCAAGAAVGRGRIEDPGAHNLGMALVQADDAGAVDILPLDAMAIEGPVRLIKIDAEGMDAAILEGAARILATDHPAIVVEAPGAEAYRTIATRLARYGYVAAGSYNYTPTHLFTIPAQKGRVADRFRVVADRLALQYIESAERRQQLDRDLSALRAAVSGLNAKSGRADQRLGALEERGQGSEATTETLRGDLRASEQAITRLTDDQADLRTDLAAHATGVLETMSGLAAAVDRFERHQQAVDAALQDLGLRLAARDEEAAARAERVRQALDDVTAGVARHGDHLAGFAADLTDRVARGERAVDAAMHELGLRLATQDEEAAARAERLRQTLDDVTAGVARHDDHLAGFAADLTDRVARQSLELADLRSDLDRDRRAIEIGLSRSQEAQAAADDRISATLARQGDLAVELALLAATDHDTNLRRVATRLEALIERRIESRISAVIERRFADLTARLTDAIGAASADRQLIEELGRGGTPTGPDEIHALLGLPAPDGPAERSWPAVVAGTRPSLSEDAARNNVWFVKGATPRPSTPHDEDDPPASAPSGEPLSDLDYRQTWERRAWAQAGTILDPDGRVHGTTGQDRIGFVGPMIACPDGGLIEISVRMTDWAPSGTRPILRLQTESGVGIGPDFPLDRGETVVRAFAPHETRSLKFYLLLNAPSDTAHFTVECVRLRRLPAEVHRLAVARRIGEPVLASMASIPSRRSMLRDCVASLLVQCDRVRVFLNGYSDIPDFLVHPRVEVRRSQDWDDRGDAGKFFWIDRDVAEGGYRLIVDDDLIFPPDFAEVMTAKIARHGGRALFATHGVLLRQPFAHYYGSEARAATFHFAHRLAADRGVHIGATNAMCFRAGAVSMAWSDFKYCNSADVWISLHAREHGLPIFTPARPANWVRESRHETPSETIYHHSLGRTKSRFDSSLVQDAVLRHACPLTLTTAGRAKVAVAIEIRDVDRLPHDLRRWITAAALAVEGTELVVVLGCDPRDTALAEAVAGISIPHETHLVDLRQTDTDFAGRVGDLHRRLECDATMLWIGEAAVEEPTDAPSPEMPASGNLSCSPLGGVDVVATWRRTETGPVLGLSIGSHEKVERLLRHARPDGGETIADLSPDEVHDLARRLSADTEASLPSPRLSPPIGRPLRVDDVFERRIVLNLDRRPDRWETVRRRLTGAGIEAERFAAVDGRDPDVAAEYEAYRRGPLVEVAPELNVISNSQDLYMDYAGQNARIAHLEATSGSKAIASAGAWGYLRSYETILEAALSDQVESLLVLDDDVVFHRDFARLFDAAMRQLPEDWLIVQFGTLQYNWNPPWADWRSSHLYRTNGAAIGSHAVGMRFDVLPYLLDQTKRMDMPFDIGALSAAVRAFRDRCFVIHPNLAIQSLADSDIGTSDFQRSRSAQEIAAVYRWTLQDYDFEGLEPAPGSTVPNRA